MYLSSNSPDSSTATVLSAELTTINSQLMSHGWAKRPLNLDALSQKDYNEVVAVLFELMGASVVSSSRACRFIRLTENRVT